MSYPITPDPSIHTLPPAEAAKENQQNVTEIKASGGKILQTLLNALLSLLTGGVLGTGKTNSGSAAQSFSNLFTNFFSMLGIPNPGQALATVQTDLFDTQQTITGFVNKILAPTGILHLESDAQKFWDGLWSALTGQSGSGKSAQDVASAAANIQTTVASHASTLAIRNNQPAFMGNGPTEEGVFQVSLIQGTPVYQSLKANNAIMGFVRIGQVVNKDTVTWLGENTANLTGFYINVYQLDTNAGGLTLVHQSTNQITSVANVLAWNVYVLPTSIAVNPGEVYGIEIVVTGTGTYSIAGIDQSWMPSHPTNYPALFCATRDPSASPTSPPSTISSANYSGHLAWYGFGVDTGNGFHAPVAVSYPTAGSGSYIIPTWANYVDCIIMGGGSGGHSGGAGAANGGGGVGGSWNAATIQIGVDVPVGTSTINYTVGAGTPHNGGAAGSSSVSATGWAGITASGGAAASTIVALATNWASTGAGNITYPASGANSTTYYGGGVQTTYGKNGASPGGGAAGGAGGQFSGYQGGDGADGIVWFVARSN